MASVVLTPAEYARLVKAAGDKPKAEKKAEKPKAEKKTDKKK